MGIKKWIGAFLLLVILSTSIYVLLPEKVKLSVEETRTKLYVYDEDLVGTNWELIGTEYLYLWDGTTKLRAKDRLVESFDLSNDITAIVRTAWYKDSIATRQTYTFNGSIEDVSFIPISHIAECFNCTGKIVSFEYRDIEYDGETRLASSPEIFGKLKIEWEGNPYLEKIYQYKTVSPKLMVRYRPQSNYETYSIRMSDPELISLSNLEILKSNVIDVGLDRTRGISLNHIYENGKNCVIANITDDISLQDISFLFTNANSGLDGHTLERLESKDVDIYGEVCNPYELSANETIYQIDNCTTEIIGSKEAREWNAIQIKGSDKSEEETLNTFEDLGKGAYKYCVPERLNLEDGKLKSYGEVMVSFNDILVTDRQGSSIFNDTWDNWRVINITDTETMINLLVNISISEITGSNDGCAGGSCRIYNNFIGAVLDYECANESVTTKNVSCSDPTATQARFFFNTSDLNVTFAYNPDTAVPDGQSSGLMHWERTQDYGKDITTANWSTSDLKDWTIVGNIYMEDGIFVIHNGGSTYRADIPPSSEFYTIKRAKSNKTEVGGGLFYTEEPTHVQGSAIWAFWSNNDFYGYDGTGSVYFDNGMDYALNTYYDFKGYINVSGDFYDIYNITNQSEVNNAGIELRDSTGAAITREHIGNGGGATAGIFVSDLWWSEHDFSVSRTWTIDIGEEETANIAPTTPDPIYDVSVAYNNTDLNCSVATYINDGNEDNMTVYFNLTIDGTHKLENILTEQLNGSQPSWIIYHGNYSKENVVKCNITLYDGTDLSITNSTDITISNSYPTLTEVILNSTLGTNFTIENLTAYPINGSDIDDDYLIYSYDWRISGASDAVLNMPFNVNGSNENTTNVKDYTSYSNNGTIINNPIWNSSCEAFNDSGGCYRFDGIDDYIEINDTDSLSFTTGSADKPFTILSWINPRDATGFRAFSKGGNSLYGREYYFGTNGTGNLSMQIFGGNWNLWIMAESTIDLCSYENQWILIGATYDGSGEKEGITIYLNGNEIDSVKIENGAYSYMINRVESAYIGRYFNSSLYANGSIDQVMVWNRSLGASEITLIYNDGGGTYNVTHSDATSPSETWIVYVTPNDGTNDGDTVASNGIDILGVEINVTISEPTNTTYANLTILFDIETTGSYLDSCWYNLDNNSTNTTYTCNSTFTLNTLEGEHYFIAYANDTLDNLNHTTVSFYVDSIAPYWQANATVPVSGGFYNPEQDYIFSINWTDNFNLVNATLEFNSVKYIHTFSGITSNITNYTFATLGAGNYSYNFTACDGLNNCNTTDTWIYEIRKESISTLLYLDENQANLTYTYNPLKYVNLSAYTSNLTVALYIDGSAKSNPLNTSFGAGLFNITAITDGNNNYTSSNETWWLNISKLITNTTLYLNSNRSNLTIIYEDLLNFTAYSSNNSYTSLNLFVNDTNWTNPFIGNISAGEYNITAITDGNRNITESSETWWLTINKYNITVQLYLNNNKSNLSQIYGDDLNITAYTDRLTLVLYINDSLTDNPFNGTLSAGFYNITTIADSNRNYTGDFETWWLNISKQNTSIALYINGTRGDYEIRKDLFVNFTIYLLNDSSSLLHNNVSFYNNFSGTWSEIMNNASPLYNSTNTTDISVGHYLIGGRWDGNANYTTSAENWTLELFDFNLTVAYSENISVLTYICFNISNNTATQIPPCNQTSDIGVFNITLNSEGSNSNGTLWIRMNTTLNNVTILLGNNSNYSIAQNLTTTYKEFYYNLTMDVSILIWHWMDLISPPPGTVILYDLIFEARRQV